MGTSKEKTSDLGNMFSLTGQENLNEVPPVEDMEGYTPFEMVVFKVRGRSPSYTAENGMADNDCTTKQCNCKSESVQKNLRSFCNALLAVAHCRSLMCPYTLENILKDEIFGVWFDWMEYGDFLNGAGDREANCFDTTVVSTDTDDVGAKNIEKVTDCVPVSETADPVSSAKQLSIPCTSISSQSLLKQPDSRSNPSRPEKQDKVPSMKSVILVLNPAIMGPRPSPKGKDERISETSQKVSPAGENAPTVPPDEPSQNKTSSTNLSTESDTESQTKKSSRNEVTSNMESQVSNPVEKTPIVSSITQHTSLPNQETVCSPTPLENTVDTAEASLFNQETAKNSAIPLTENGMDAAGGASQPESNQSTKSSTPETIFGVSNNHVPLSTRVCDNNGEESTVQREESTDSIHQQRQLSTSAPETTETLPVVSERETEAIAGSTTVLSIPSDSASVSSSRLVIDTSFESMSSIAVEAEKEDPKAAESANSSQSSSSTRAPEKMSQNIPLTSSFSNTQPISPGTTADSSSAVPQQPACKGKQILATAEGLVVYTTDPNATTLNEGSIESKRSIFGAGDSVRVRKMLGRKVYIALSSETVHSQPETGEEAMEEGEIGNSESGSVDGSVDTNVSTVKSMSASESDCNNKSEPKKTPATILQEQGVKTRSKSITRPAPASVKRQRVSRTAKESAHAKISSTLVSGTSSNVETEQSSVKDGEATITASVGQEESRLEFSDASQSQTSSSSTAETVRVETVRMDESKSEACTGVPAVDDLDQQLKIETTEKNPPVAVLQGTEKESAKKDNNKTNFRSENEEIPETASPAVTVVISSSDDSDSGESQCSTISQIPLMERLEKKRKREEKNRKKAAQATAAPQSTNKHKLPKMNYDSDQASRHSEISVIAHKTRSRRRQREQKLLAANRAASSSNLTRSNRKDRLKNASAFVERNKKQREKSEERERFATKCHIEDNDDDDIQMIEERAKSMPPPTAEKDATLSKTTSRQDNHSSKNTMNAAPSKVCQEGNIKITFNKEKAKSAVLQRSTSSPAGDSPILEHPSNSPLISSDAKNSSTSPVSISSSTTTAAEKELVLEDRPSWEFEAGVAPRKMPQKLSEIDNVSKSTSASETSERRQSVEMETSKTPSASSSVTRRVSDPAVESPLRPSLRIRKPIFDPKMEAFKIGPKPVPTVRKETLQQQQQITSSSQTLTCSNKPKEKDREEQQSTGESVSTMASNKEMAMPAKNTTESIPEKVQSIKNPQPTKEKDADDDIAVLSTDTSELVILTTRRGSKERSPTLAPQPQLQHKQQPSQQSRQKATNSEQNATRMAYVDGEIRALPIPNANSGNSVQSGASKGNHTFTQGGTWRRGSSVVRREPVSRNRVEDTIDFETPPDDDERRRSNDSRNNISRGRGGGFRGGANHNHRGGSHQGGNFQNSPFQGHPRSRGGGVGTSGPRPPFRQGGGEPSSRGRSNNQRQHPHQNQFPGLVDLRDIQFNSQFVPQFSVQPQMAHGRVQREGRSNIFPMNEGPFPADPPDFNNYYPPPYQQSFRPPHYY